MLTLVLISSLLTTPVQPAQPGAPPREGYEAVIAPKGVVPSDPARQRAVYAGKVEAAWRLADDAPVRSEAEAGP